MDSLSILKVRDKSDNYYTNFKNIPNIPMRMLIVGKSFLSGKSTVILNLLLRDKFYKNHFKGDNIYIVSNNKMDQKMLILRQEKDVPSENCIEYSEHGLELIYNKIEEECMSDVNDDKKPVNSLVVIDDCAFGGDLKSKNNGILSRLACNGRHINCSLIVTAQKYTQISTTVRSNASCAILFSNSMKEVDCMEQDLNYLDNKRDFVKIFRSATSKPNSFMVVDFTSEDLYKDSEFNPLTL